MRTTLTLDPDVAAQLRARARQLGAPFKQVVNDALRRGLGAGVEPVAYQVPVHDLRIRPGVDLDRALTLAAALEDEATVAKLRLRK